MEEQQTTLDVTVCHTNHLTAFGGFFVAPNPLALPTWKQLKEGYLLMVVVFSILLLYFIGLVFTRRADNEDMTKVLPTDLLEL